MKDCLWCLEQIKIPNLSAGMGNGTILVSEDLYYEYEHKRREFIRLAEELVRQAQKQGLITW